MLVKRKKGVRKTSAVEKKKKRQPVTTTDNNNVGVAEFRQTTPNSLSALHEA